VNQRTSLGAALQEGGEILPLVLEEHAERQPDRPFLYYGDDRLRLSYREAVERIRGIAAGLAHLGVAKGDRVSVYLENPYITTLAMYGTWRAGAVFAPINQTFRQDVLRYQLTDTESSVVITERSLVPHLLEVDPAECGIKTIIVYDPPAGTSGHVPADARVRVTAGPREVDFAELQQGGTPPALELGWDDCANIFYTSGTTGRPKGVELSHRWMNQYTYPYRQISAATDVVYSDLPLYHVGGAIFNIARAGWVGASVALWNRFSARSFWDRIDESQATQALWVDVMTTRLMNQAPRADDRSHTLDKVYISPLPTHHAAIAERFNISWFVVGFGQTESGMPIFGLIDEEQPDRPACRENRGLSPSEVRRVAADRGLRVARGRDIVRKGFMGGVLPFFTVDIVDEQDQPCDDNQTGELVVRPLVPGLLFKGYRGKPEQTLHAVRNLWFHTGDACVRDETGAYYYVDRLGDRIRVKGENISSSYVEDLINRCPEVEMSAAFAVPSDEGFEDSLVVYCVPVKDRPVTAASVLEWCKASLPKIMVPSHIELIDELPRTPTNKIQKQQLKREFLQRKATARTGTSMPT